MPRHSLLALAVLLFAGIHCNKNDDILPVSLFELPVAIEITGEIPGEVSGMTDSQKNPGHCWVQQDSGNPPEIILINHNGRVAGKVYLKGASNLDWEDIIGSNVPGSAD